MAAPPRLALEVEPAVAAPGETVAVAGADSRDRVRPIGGDGPAAGRRRRIVAPDGEATPVRLWPSAEPGAFEARVRAPNDGRYVIEASAGDVTAALPLTVPRTRGGRHRAAATRTSGHIWWPPGATGGVVASEADLSGHRAAPAHPAAGDSHGTDPSDPLARIRGAVRRRRVRRMGAAPATGAGVIDGYLTFLRDVRRMSPNTVESYARDLAVARRVRRRALDRRSRR